MLTSKSAYILCRWALLAWALTAFSGCSMVSLHMPEEYRDQKTVEDAPPGDIQQPPAQVAH